jgi:hypothetical protein
VLHGPGVDPVIAPASIDAFDKDDLLLKIDRHDQPVAVALDIEYSTTGHNVACFATAQRRVEKAI